MFFWKSSLKSLSNLKNYIEDISILDVVNVSIKLYVVFSVWLQLANIQDQRSKLQFLTKKKENKKKKKSEKLLQILIKLLNPQLLFCKSQTNLYIQELSLNPEKYFANPKKYLVTCYMRQQSASIRVCFRHFALSKMVEERVCVIFCNVSLMTLEYVPLCMIHVNCRLKYFRRACRYDESLGASRLSIFYNLCKSHSKASLFNFAL